MNKEQLLNEWLKEEKVAHINGWDFSHLQDMICRRSPHILGIFMPL